jgi:hypothetical protein
MPGNVPAELSSFIGREQLLADLTRQLSDSASPSRRLLTLTGAGGSGETRVALQAARAMAEDFEDGAWFVSLAPISNPRLVMGTIAQTLIVRDAGGAAYWARRPFQLDADIRSVFPTPAHPSYPSAHGCASGAEIAVLAALFPSDASYLNAQGDAAGYSRIWVGIHFCGDVETGLALGRSVADRVILQSR